MTESILFMFFGALAVAFAAFMLVSENAVHSALFLILTMGCIAVLFLLLDAPFLAMIQITVYAGAIMVLFLFVIMLLGAERLQPDEPGEGRRKYRWFTPVASVLVVSFFVAFGASFLAGGLDSRELPLPDPQVRVVHAAPNAGPVEVMAGGTAIATELDFQEASDYIELPAGEQALTVVGADGASLTTNVTLEPGSAQTIIAYGDEAQPQFAVVPADRSTTADRSGRFVVFNAYSGAETVSMVDQGSEFNPDDTVLLAPNLTYGQYSEPLDWREGAANWTFIEGTDDTDVLYRLREIPVERDTSSLVVIGSEALFDGSLRPLAFVIPAEARASFGGPQAIGYMLFTDYLLPFQLLAVLLLSAMVGVIVLTHRETVRDRRESGRRRVVSRPLATVVAAQVGQDALPETTRTPEPTTTITGD